MGGPEKVETERGSAGLVRGRDEGCQADETNGKGKGKVLEEKANTEAKTGSAVKERRRMLGNMRRKRGS